MVFNPVLIPNDKPNQSQYVSAKDRNGKTIVKRDVNGQPIRRKMSQYLTLGDVWDMPILSPNARERLGYPTQKPLALLERIIKASSDEGDIVLDPFCGCATTCEASERLGRQWVGIDLSSKAGELVLTRLERAADAGALFKDGALPKVTLWEHNDDAGKVVKPLVRTDQGVPLKGKAKAKVKQKLYGRQGGDCSGCGEHFRYNNLTVDHIVPRSKGGGDFIENYQLLCGWCNSVKGDRPQEYLVDQLKKREQKKLKLVV